MSNLNGLASQENFAKFRRQWQLLALEEAGKWTGNRDTQLLLADVVLASLRREYASRVPSENMAYFIRAQTCLIFSVTGDSPEHLREYIRRHGLMESIPAHNLTPEVREGEKPSAAVSAADEAEKPGQSQTGAVRRRRRQSETMSRSGYAAPAGDTNEWESESEELRDAVSMWAEQMEELQHAGISEGLVPAAGDESVREPVPAAQKLPESRPAPVRDETGHSAGNVPERPVPVSAPPASADSAVPVSGEAKPVNAHSGKRAADTFYDPERTQFWTPGPLEETEHVVEEVSIPDEEETDPSSPRLSLINTVLFIAMVAAFIFMVYESRVIQHYLL